MTNYTATIRSHDISRAREIKISGTLQQAKTAADEAFGDGFIGHEIVIYKEGRIAEIARRTIGRGGWQNVEY